MQPASMLGVGPVQGSSFLNNSQVVGGAGPHKGLDERQPSQIHPQSEHQVPGYPKMDDLMEIFSSPVWPDINSMGRVPWDFNAMSSGSAMSMEAGSEMLGSQKMFTMSLLPSGLPGTSVGRQGLANQIHEVEDPMGQPYSNESGHCPDSILIAARLNRHQGFRDGLVSSVDGAKMALSQVDGRVQALPHVMQEAPHNALQRISEGSSRAPGLTRSPSMGSSGSEISGCQQLPSDTQSPPSVPTLWRKYCMGGVLIPPGGAPNESHLGKRPRDDEARTGSQESMFNTYVGTHGQEVRSAGQQSHSQVSQGVSVPPYASHTGLGQPQGAAAVVAGTARPRVRARRGQATDPHSIAERLRRERIADRMKSLQELVPNSNKTDKASMLDEIIEYVRFLQLQVKVLSMSRLGGAGAVAPLVADLPAEGHSNFIATAFGRSTSSSGTSQESMTMAERQVARLMEEDMGTAMQFLQTKGLCLMPISLATAISSTSGRPATGSDSGLTGRVDASSTTILASANAISSGLGTPTVADEATATGINGLQNSKEAVIQPNGVGSGHSSSVVNNGGKLNDESAQTRSLGS